ncbi:GNAT family N-acetyltransferase [Paracoccus cavernae]|uniref:GNAT family N-acetyltransferase n=1 Tax=Paracoccus cavernae TaxID=1571207 RepID=A0ABT8D9L4_9RHOB|nr:GNAT family N-acetyltransferase [Paracoccus cavernae]
MTIKIRPATTDDIAGIFHVRTHVRENHMSRDELTRAGITEAAVAGMIASQPCAWVAVTGDAVTGDAVMGFSMVDLDEGSLFAAFVLPESEGQGIGRELVLLAEDALFARHPAAWLETGAATRAAGFYRALGWGNEQDIGGGDIRLEKRRPKG